MVAIRKYQYMSSVFSYTLNDLNSVHEDPKGILANCQPSSSYTWSIAPRHVTSIFEPGGSQIWNLSLFP